MHPPVSSQARRASHTVNHGRYLRSIGRPRGRNPRAPTPPFDAEDRPPSPPSHANRLMTSIGDNQVCESCGTRDRFSSARRYSTGRVLARTRSPTRLAGGRFRRRPSVGDEPDLRRGPRPASGAGSLKRGETYTVGGDPRVPSPYLRCDDGHPSPSPHRKCMSYGTRDTLTTRSRTSGWPATTKCCPGPLPGPATNGRSQHEPAESRTSSGRYEAGATGLEPATSGVTGRRSNQLSYAPEGEDQYAKPGGMTPMRHRGASLAATR
jgi:hypothetical protein